MMKRLKKIIDVKVLFSFLIGGLFSTFILLPLGAKAEGEEPVVINIPTEIQSEGIYPWISKLVLGSGDESLELSISDGLKVSKICHSDKCVDVEKLYDIDNTIIPDITGDIQSINSNINSITGDIQSINLNIGSITGSIESINQNISGITGEVSGLSGVVDGILGTIGTIPVNNTIVDMFTNQEGVIDAIKKHGATNDCNFDNVGYIVYDQNNILKVCKPDGDDGYAFFEITVGTDAVNNND